MSSPFAVVVPTFDRRESLLRVLGQVADQARAAGLSPLLVVVVDGSRDGTQEAVRRHCGEAALILEGDGSWWWTRAVNTGCRAALRAGAEAVLLLNDDVDLDPEFLVHLRAAAESHAGAIVGALNLTADGRIFFSGAASVSWPSARLARYHEFLSPGGHALRGTRPSVVLTGRGLWVPARVFEQHGFFDERWLPQYKADYDFVLRAHERGVPCLVCWDAVVHLELGSGGRGATFAWSSLGAYLRSSLSRYSRNGLLPNLVYYARHTPRWAWPLLPVIAARVAACHLLRLLRERGSPSPVLSGPNRDGRPGGRPGRA